MKLTEFVITMMKSCDPLKKLGCKLRHENSPTCTLKKRSNSLCQYRHKTNDNLVPDEDINIEVEKTMDKRIYLYTSTQIKGKLKGEE